MREEEQFVQGCFRSTFFESMFQKPDGRASQIFFVRSFLSSFGLPGDIL